MTEKLDLLFGKRPPVWGYRGDVQLWAALRNYFEVQGLPETIDQFHNALECGYELLTGSHLSSNSAVYVKKFTLNTHGMSRGVVSPHFWRESGIPLLLKRYRLLVEVRLFNSV
jgi:hypothetical protein